jgi:phosphatidylserine/phosphatidylglycerophosphate/cardiolipin synthase-like enzyme
MSDKKHEPHEVIVQPDDGAAAVVALLDGARKSLRLKQFTLTDPDILAALERAHARGVVVRVMLNPHRSGGDRANDESFAHLRRRASPSSGPIPPSPSRTRSPP